MSQHHSHTQRNQHQHNFQSNQSYAPKNPLEQRREFLWRERVRLELQVQSLLARATTLHQQWQHLQARKAVLGHRVPKVAGQILLAGLVGIRQLPAERLYAYEKDRIAQEEDRIQQDLIRCNGDAAALQAQISVIEVELSLL
jgi:hypothetical protein